MKNTHLLPQELAAEIIRRDKNSRVYFQVGIDIYKADGNVLTVGVEQVHNLGEVYNVKRLIQFGKSIMDGVTDLGYTVHYHPKVWRSDCPAAVVDHQWVRDKLEQTGINQTQLSEALGVTRHTISKLLSGKYALTHWHRAALFYFFKSLSHVQN